MLLQSSSIFVGPGLSYAQESHSHRSISHVPSASQGWDSFLGEISEHLCEMSILLRWE